MKPTGSAARLALALTLALAGAGAGVTHAQAQAHAQDQAAARSYDVQLTMKVDGQDVADALHAQENRPFTVSGKAGDKRWRAEFVLNRVHDAGTDGARPAVRLAGTITEDGRTLAQPTLVGWLGERMAVQAGDGVRLAFVVKDRAP